MPRFDAGALVDPLDYVFKPFYNGQGAEGTVPEPSDKQIGDFLSAIKRLFEDAAALGGIEGADQDDPAAMLDALNQLDGDEFVKIMGEMCEMYGALCSHKPSGAVLRKVPIRPRRLFFEWIQTEVLSPEARPAAGTAGPLTQA